MKALTALVQAGRWVGALHRNEKGADEGANKLIIFALISLPLIALLILFGGDILEFAKDTYQQIVGDSKGKNTKPKFN